MINRYSSRRQRLDESFLNRRLFQAQSYDRIAGYFRSSVLEVAAEALESVSGKIRVICNSDLDARDVETARAANLALRREWCAAEPEKLLDANPAIRDRFARLYDLLVAGKMEVRVLPCEKFGLAHGKAGIINLRDGQRTSFMGSANETWRAWRANYEIVWEDDSPEAIAWVQEEFDALWSNQYAVQLSDFVISDIGRLARRQVVPSVELWRAEPQEGAAIIETPVYRREYGLWAHQKYFIKLAFDVHRTKGGARFVLADMVGLGKTVQLAAAAMLMALYGERPVLIIAPKALLWQWQDELKTLLGLPAAVWQNGRWTDENGIEYPAVGSEGIKRCPRRVGIVSQGLMSSRAEAAAHLLTIDYECVIIDEAHRARRKNLGPQRTAERADPNNLLRFIDEIALKTKSLLLATATPVQLYPVEVWDLLKVLAQGNEHVLGTYWSEWHHADKALDVVMRREALPKEDAELWRWIRNPLPPADEGRDFEILRRALALPDEKAVAAGGDWDKLGEPDRARVRRMRSSYGEMHNPFIRHVVRRTREYLENTYDPETGEPFLKPVRVELFGEDDAEAIRLPLYLQEAYEQAEDFCRSLAGRANGAGFLRTLLLRRVGSTIQAGLLTATKILQGWENIPEEDEDENIFAENALKTITPSERQLLEAFVKRLEANRERDPKFEAITDILLRRGWLKHGCIIFSQYYDSIMELARSLSGEMPDESIGIYAGADKSGIIKAGVYTRAHREDLKQLVRIGDLRLLLGTDAASEGLNLQRLGTLINLDLPWNPTRLEQRKGRIQRIGQLRDTVWVYNMRYKDSVEDRVHDLLSARLASIHRLFGQIPDVLEDVWIEVALGRIEAARQTIDSVPQQHPFEIKYHRVSQVDWESCAQVLDVAEQQKHFLQGW